MRSDKDLPLVLPDNVVFTCQQSGACCRSDWLIGVDHASHTALRDVAWERIDPPSPAPPSCPCRSRFPAASA